MAEEKREIKYKQQKQRLVLIDTITFFFLSFLIIEYKRRDEEMTSAIMITYESGKMQTMPRTSIDALKHETRACTNWLMQTNVFFRPNISPYKKHIVLFEHDLATSK